MNPFSADFDPFGLVKGIEPVPWGKAQANPIVPGYYTWVGLGAGFVFLLVDLPLLWLTSEYWLVNLALGLLCLYAVDVIATTTVVVRRKRRKKRAEHHADADPAKE